MKKTGYLLLVGGILLISKGAMAADPEEPEYTLLAQSDDFELRRYDEQLIAQTWVSGDQRAASRAGFKILADYIFGNNTAPTGGSSKISMTAPVTMQSDNKGNNESQKIAMTAPVSMQQDDGKWRVQFTMPSKYTMETLPKPNNPEVEIIELPAQNYGVKFLLCIQFLSSCSWPFRLLITKKRQHLLSFLYLIFWLFDLVFLLTNDIQHTAQWFCCAPQQLITNGKGT